MGYVIFFKSAVFYISKKSGYAYAYPVITSLYYGRSISSRSFAGTFLVESRTNFFTACVA